jgi:hypothetical protein
VDIRLIAVDLDGTLLTSQKALAPEGARLLTEATRDGKHVVLATTRNPDSVLPLCGALGIDHPIICTNGAQVWGSPQGPVWAYHSVPCEAALAIARLADRRGWELSITVGAMTYWRQRPGQELGPAAGNVTVVASNVDAIVGEPAERVVRMLTWDSDAVDGIGQLCRSDLADQCYAETYYNPDGTVHALGVFALQANKGAALDLVLGRLQLKPAQVLAIGDNLNDLPMFARARVSVAMGNGPDEVKREATRVAPSNDQEGVAWALRAYGVA